VTLCHPPLSFSMGRRKIVVQKIEDPRTLHATQKKRATGLVKKAMELSILCDVEVVVMVRPVNESPMTMYTSSVSMDESLQRFSSAEKHTETELYYNKNYMDLCDMAPRSQNTNPVVREMPPVPLPFGQSRENYMLDVSDVTDQIMTASQNIQKPLDYMCESLSKYQGTSVKINSFLPRETPSKPNPVLSRRPLEWSTVADRIKTFFPSTYAISHDHRKAEANPFHVPISYFAGGVDDEDEDEDEEPLEQEEPPEADRNAATPPYPDENLRVVLPPPPKRICVAESK
jgi:hypothetical protein